MNKPSASRESSWPNASTRVLPRQDIDEYVQDFNESVQEFNESVQEFNGFVQEFNGFVHEFNEFCEDFNEFCEDFNVFCEDYNGFVCIAVALFRPSVLALVQSPQSTTTSSVSS